MKRSLLRRTHVSVSYAGGNRIHGHGSEGARASFSERLGSAAVEPDERRIESTAAAAHHASSAACVRASRRPTNAGRSRNHDDPPHGASSASAPWALSSGQGRQWSRSSPVSSSPSLLPSPARASPPLPSPRPPTQPRPNLQPMARRKGNPPLHPNPLALFRPAPFIHPSIHPSTVWEAGERGAAG